MVWGETQLGGGQEPIPGFCIFLAILSSGPQRHTTPWPCPTFPEHSPLALASMQDKLLTAPGADRQLVLRGVEDIQEKMAPPGTV